ncbi:AIPR protein [Jannaschia faecimaris]|uniref:AIPR protein n=1 Tax=Jannaschia faecimaris TaxID=1244108 RepID=A0A1H3UHI6_9RHOB|nr:AIPR protein [Jannaschia faecimaris]
MFFSYNNGLSATADSVEVEKTSDGLRIVSATNLQIVNGGQTTASLHAARKISPETLEQVHVQMKLTVVPSNAYEEVVPFISKYANSQNKVSAADFFSNYPFHMRMEEYSRRVLAPAAEGTNRET